MRRFDYTAARKGSRTRDGKIVVCPRCGRKGAYKTYPPRKNSRVVALVTHGGHEEFFHTIDDHCILTAEDVSPK